MTGADLKALREEWGLTLDEMADLLGYSHRQSLWKAEQKDAVSGTVARLVECLKRERER